MAINSGIAIDSNIDSLRIAQLLSNSYQIESPLKSIEILSALGFSSEIDLQDSIKSKKHDEALSYLYKKVKEKEFNCLYQNLLESLASNFKQKIIYQPSPTVRIQWPNNRAGNLHIDSWVGHGSSTINFWLPLTSVNHSSTIWICNKENTSRLIENFKKNKLTISELEELAWPFMKPFLPRKDHLLTFNNSILHGSKRSTDSLPRVSIDFRISFPPYEIGTKIKGMDYIEQSKYDKQNRTEVGTIVYSSNKLKNLSHNVQRLLIKEFCSRNNFAVIAEASEFYGMNHYPQIANWVQMYPSRPIVISSLEAFNNESLIKEIAKSHKPGIYDAFRSEKI